MTTPTSHYTGEERSKRIFAIVGALIRQPGRMVRLLRLRVLRDLFRAGVLPLGQPSRCNWSIRPRCVRRRVPDAAYRRLDFRPGGGPSRAQELDDDLGADDVLRLVAHRLPAHLQGHWRLGATVAVVCAFAAGAVGGWRIRHHRHLHERSRPQGPTRLFRLVPVRDADRRAIAGGVAGGDPATVPRAKTSCVPMAGGFHSWWVPWLR